MWLNNQMLLYINYEIFFLCASLMSLFNVCIKLQSWKLSFKLVSIWVIDSWDWFTFPEPVSGWLAILVSWAPLQHTHIYINIKHQMTSHSINFNGHTSERHLKTLQWPYLITEPRKATSLAWYYWLPSIKNKQCQKKNTIRTLYCNLKLNIITASYVYSAL